MIHLIIIGDEILSGRRQDKHLQKTIEILQARGMALQSCEYVADDRAAIVATLQRAFAYGHPVFCTGGIGSTPDDHTRQAAAQALGLPLVRHPQAQALIRARIQAMAQEKGTPVDPADSTVELRLQMGDFPEGAQIIPNPFNQIPGFHCNQVYFFPGFPVMAWPMMEWVLDTHYHHLHHHQPLLERSLIVQGTMEAALAPLMQSVQTHYPSIRVFSLPSVDHPTYGPHIELGVKGRNTDHVALAFTALQQGLEAVQATVIPS